MSLWSIHPKYLDRKSLISLWREGLMVQRFLERNKDINNQKSQVIYFKNQDDPLKVIGSYLSFVASEGARQGCRFNHEKILYPNFDEDILIVDEQDVKKEVVSLLRRLKPEDRKILMKFKNESGIELNPIFNYSIN